MTKCLELIQLITSGNWYWWLDYRYADNLDGKCAASIEYKTDRDAINALLSNSIEWEKLDD